jgi:hypothetical protein
MIHDARIVPTTNKPHLPKKVRQLHGDPRGRWEGDTLVVETTNYINGFQGSTPDVKITDALHACQRGLHQLAGDRRRSRDLDQAVYVHGPPEEDRRAGLRIRVPRGQLRDGRHSRRCPYGRGEG